MSTWTGQTKAGQGWLYNESTITYNASVEDVSQNAVYYNGTGTVTTWTNENET